MKWAAAVASWCWASLPKGADAQTEPASSQPAPASDAATGPAAVRTPEHNGEPMAWVHLDGPGGARLEQDVDSVLHEDWNPVCVAPCDTWVPTSLDFRVSGGGLFPSQDFSLHPDPQQHANVSVSGGSIPLLVIGIVATAGGALTTTTGLGFFLQGSMAGATWGSVNSPSDQNTGRILMGSGAAAVVVGLVLILTNRHSHVSGDVAPTLSNQLHSMLEPPTFSNFREAAPSIMHDVAGGPPWLPAPPALSLPVLRGAF